jgi:hypothetical protein
MERGRRGGKGEKDVRRCRREKKEGDGDEEKIKAQGRQGTRVSLQNSEISEFSD